MIRLLSATLLTVLTGSILLNFLLLPVQGAEESTVSVRVRIEPEQTIIVDNANTITHIINPISYAPVKTLVRRNHIHGEVVERSEKIDLQYEQIDAEHDLSGPGVVYEGKQTLFGRVYGTFVGFFITLFNIS